jgi:predicted RNA-binding protein YlxR (DUF448 family)
MKKSQPIRMCITCRSRHPQNTLIRLQLSGHKVLAFTGIGRSFYICGTCVKNEKKVKGLAKRFKQELEAFTRLVTELSLAVNSCDTSHQN